MGHNAGNFFSSAELADNSSAELERPLSSVVRKYYLCLALLIQLVAFYWEKIL